MSIHSKYTDSFFLSHINAQRYQIPDVPVLYFLEPTNSNLKLIASDLQRNLYGDAYINFLYSIPRPLMEDFANQVAVNGTAESIAQLYDQYLNFVVGEPNLFSLAMGRETYWSLNSNSTSDEKLDSLIDRAVAGLFSVAVTTGAEGCISCEARLNLGRIYTHHPFPQRWTSGNDCD